MNMTNLEPNILYAERARRVGDYVFEALETQHEFLLLLVNYAEAKVDFICLFKFWFHAHDLGESLFGMLERTVSIVEDTDAIPELWFLDAV